MDNSKKVLSILISVIIAIALIGGIYYLISNDNGNHYSGKKDNSTINNNDKNENETENESETDDEEETENEDNNGECDKYELYFKSEKLVSKDYSSLISNLDYSKKTTSYCYSDLCSSKESDLLERYNDENEDTEETSGFSDFKAEIKDGKVVINTDEETITLDVKNIVAIESIFDVSDGVNLFMLDKNGNLYYYNAGMDKKYKNIYSNVKDFTVFEGNDYISEIEPSEGQNIKVALHTNDNKLLVGGFSKESFYNIKSVNYSIIHSEDLDFPDIYVSQSNEYNYEKNNGKVITVKEVFIVDKKLYLYITDKVLLSTTLNDDTNYCKLSYTKVKDSKVKSFTYNDSSKEVKITFEDGTTETYTYSYKIDI